MGTGRVHLLGETMRLLVAVCLLVVNLLLAEADLPVAEASLPETVGTPYHTRTQRRQHQQRRGLQIGVGRFLWLSDLHYDPYYGTKQAVSHSGGRCKQSSARPYGQNGCDSPAALLREALTTLPGRENAANGDFDFVIITGDVSRHGNEKLPNPLTDTQAILANVSETLRSSVGPEIPIIPSIGNNDVTPDYYIDVEDPTELLTMVASGFQALFDSEEEQKSFEIGGYLARNVTSAMTVISLNTLIYCTSHSPDQSYLEDPLDQFVWLESQLQVAKDSNRYVYIIGHIPPAMGSYRHSQLWEDSYLEHYYSIIARFSDLIKGHCFGHLHSDEIRLTQSKWPLLLSPSLTPIYGNNPSIRWASYQPETGVMQDYDTYYLQMIRPQETDGADDSDLNWIRGPSLLESFDLPDLSATSWKAWLRSLEDHLEDPDCPHWQALVARQQVHAEDTTSACQDLTCRKDWLCTMTTITREEYASCLEVKGEPKFKTAWMRQSAKTNLRILIALALSGALLFFLGLCYCCKRYLYRRQYHAPSTHDAKEVEDEEHHEEEEAGLPGDSLPAVT